MQETTTDSYDRIRDEAYERGADHGRSAASWYFDGNTDEDTYRRVLAGIEDGDPEIYDTFPASPLSGEWAGDPLPADVLADLGVSADDDAADDYLAAYEDGFGVAVADAIEATARAHLATEPEPEPEPEPKDWRPRLTFSYPEGSLTAWVAFDRWDGDRAQFAWEISDGENTGSGSDLRLGSGADPSLGDALACLLDFFGAFAESVEYEARTGSDSDNADLFPANLRSIASAIGSDELAMLAADVIGREDR